MIADQPLDHLTLAQAVGAPPGAVETALAELAAEYTEQGRGFDLRQVGAGWRFYTREEFAPIVEQFVVDGQQARLTQAALETLAVVAYRQPVSRARVSAIRGVNVDGVMRTLLSRGLVEEAGMRRRDRRAPVPHDLVLPRADGSDQPRRAARDRPVPAGDGRARGRVRAGRRWSRTRERRGSPTPTAAAAAAEGAGPGRASPAGASARR